MYAYFNEKTVLGLVEDDISGIVSRYAYVIKETISQGFAGIRYEHDLDDIKLSKTQTFKQYCAIHVRKEQALKVILATAKKPYIEDGDEQEATFVSLDNCEVYLEDTIVDSYGLTAAYLYHSISVGFDVLPWKGVAYTLKIVENENEQLVTAYCVTKMEDFQHPSIIAWFDEYLEPKPDKTKLLPDDKNIKLSSHHGKSELQKFANMLVKEPYIIEVVNSIDHNSFATSLVSNIPQEVDLLDLTLTDTDKGYSLRVRTVARDKREQRFIAKFLTEKYS